MIKLIILIFFITILINLINKKNIYENLVNKREWQNYRLGDILKGYCIKNKEYKYINSIEEKYPNSIADKYLRNIQKININVVKKILNEIKNKKKPNKNDIIVHLRLGDSLLDFKNNKFTYLKYKHKTYAITLNKFEKTLKKLDNKKKIILVYGIHNIKEIKKKNLSKIYLLKIRKILKKYNFKFSERKDNNPDDDFYFMSNSKIFVKSGGGFSRIISQLVKSKGNKVIDPNQDI